MATDGEEDGRWPEAAQAGCDIVTGTCRRKRRARIAVTEAGGEALPVARAEFVNGPPTKTTAAILHVLVKAAYGRWDAGEVTSCGDEHSVPMEEIISFLSGGTGKRVRVGTVHAALSEALGTALRFRYTVRTAEGRYLDRVTEANVLSTITMGDDRDLVIFRLNPDIEPLLVDPAYYHLREDAVVAGAPSAYAMVIHDLWMSELRGRARHEVEYTTSDFANLIGHPFDPAKGPNKAKIQERHVGPAISNTNANSDLIEVSQRSAPTGFVFELKSKAALKAERGGLPPPGSPTVGKTPRARAAAEWRNSGLAAEGHDLASWWSRYRVYYEGCGQAVRRRLDTEAKVAYDFVGFVRHELGRHAKPAEVGDPAWVPDAAVLRAAMAYGKRLPGGGIGRAGTPANRKVSERLLALWHAVVREARSGAEWDRSARTLLNEMLDDGGGAFQRVCAIDCANGWAALKRVELGLPAMLEYRGRNSDGEETSPTVGDDGDAEGEDALSAAEIESVFAAVTGADDD